MKLTLLFQYGVIAILAVLSTWRLASMFAPMRLARLRLTLFRRSFPDVGSSQEGVPLTGSKKKRLWVIQQRGGAELTGTHRGCGTCRGCSTDA